MNTITIELTTAVAGPDGDIKSLTLREPTGKDLRASGVPMTMGADGAMQIHPNNAATLMALLSDQPSFVIDRLSAADWMRVSTAVLGFFKAPSPA